MPDPSSSAVAGRTMAGPPLGGIFLGPTRYFGKGVPLTIVVSIMVVDPPHP